jgi:short-subunit dehydrogenase
MKDWVLITGASQGIGYEFAKLFAADGYSLVLVARDEPRLKQIAAELTVRPGVKVKVLASDLSVPDAAVKIFQELQHEQIHVEILVNNAGFGLQGPFVELDWRKQSDLLQVNITALAQMTQLFLKPMLARRSGRIMNVASTAAFVPGPFMALYYASKAHVHSFSQALAEEVAGSGVTVTAVCPGLTRSQFQARAGMKRHEGFPMMEADAVARMGYRGLMRGKRRVVTGWMNWMLVCVAGFVPVGWTARIAAGMNRTKP